MLIYHISSTTHKQQPGCHSLERLYELPGLDGRRVDDLVDVLAVAVCIGSGDVNEGLKVLHLLGQAEELLRGDHVQLQGVSAGKRRDTFCQDTFCLCVWERVISLKVCIHVFRTFARLIISLLEHFACKNVLQQCSVQMRNKQNMRAENIDGDG